MKKLLAILMCLCIMLSCVSASFAVSIPKSAQKTITLSQDHIRYKFFDEDVTIKLTYTGYLGEISAKNWAFSKELSGYEFGDVSIPVLADGSEIIFEIVSKNPTAYYNFCYENKYTPVTEFNNFMDYPWDDCGGGIWYGQDDGLAGEFPLFVFYKGGGTTRATAGTVAIDNFGRKLAANKYSYKVQNGLVRYDFHATYPLDSDGRFSPQDIIASYWLTTALSVTAKQADELEKTGLMTFTYKGDYETITYQHNYSGLAKLLGIKAKVPLSFNIIESPYLLDNGYSYNYKLTNNTDAPIRKYSAFITYLPEMVMDDDKPVFRGQIHAVDVELAAGASVTNPIVSYFGHLSTYKVLWLDFDSLAERDAFLNDSVFGEISADNIQGYRVIDKRTGGLWMAATLGVEIKSAK
jgi:hypothetical protein